MRMGSTCIIVSLFPNTDYYRLSLPFRLVHLDLKGAPPIVKYYEKLFPLIKKCGATGLLIEYEDMFPYSGKLQDIAAHNAYR